MFADSPPEDPFGLLREWYAEAEASEPNDPNAMALATVGEDGMPALRMVLLKGFDQRGLVFYTNLESRKGRHLRAYPKAALLLHWKSLRRQVRVEGGVAPVSPEEADAYFASRSRGSQIGAWASKQSQELESRYELEKRVAQYGAKYAVGHVPRPEHWSGFRVRPVRIEFWREGRFRLHDRLEYLRAEDGEGWTTRRLYP